MVPLFLSALKAEKREDETWVLLADLNYSSQVANTIIQAPKGFVTDFASVPRLPLAYLLAGNTAHEAAVIHDFLYQTHILKRALADKVFLEAMKETHVPLWRRLIMYRLVRSWGWISYKSGPSRRKILRNF